MCTIKRNTEGIVTMLIANSAESAGVFLERKTVHRYLLVRYHIVLLVLGFECFVATEAPTLAVHLISLIRCVSSEPKSHFTDSLFFPHRLL